LTSRRWIIKSLLLLTWLTVKTLVSGRIISNVSDHCFLQFCIVKATRVKHAALLLLKGESIANRSKADRRASVVSLQNGTLRCSRHLRTEGERMRIATLPSMFVLEMSSWPCFPLHALNSYLYFTSSRMYNEDISLCKVAAMSNFFIIFIILLRQGCVLTTIPEGCDRVVPLVVSLLADIYDEKIKWTELNIKQNTEYIFSAAETDVKRR